MINLTINKIEHLSIPPSTAWLPGECMRARGMEEMWMRQKPEVLEVLREQAVIQSAESSNRIEGVMVAADRLRPVVLGKSRPMDRPEEELYGYRKALDWIFARKRPVPLSADVIRKLHALAQGGMIGDAGQFKSRNNEIIEILPNGERRVRFVPTPAEETSRAVEVLCEAYAMTREKERIPILSLIATCIFDLLCIHPFRDGNGRVSRLLTTFLLMQEGFHVSRFISLESDRLRQAINDQVGPFTLSDILASVPEASPQLAKMVLRSMKQEDAIKLKGRGRGATWEATGKKSSSKK